MYVNGLRVKEEYAFVINTLKTMVFCTGNVSSNNALEHWITEVVAQLQVSHHSLSCYSLAAILYQLPM